MNNVYENCISVESDRYLIRFIKEEDVNDLLLVYSDKNAVPFFNGDNCHGDNFYYETKERITQAMKFWFDSYKWGFFVRYSLVDKKTNTVFGTFELYNRSSKDDFNGTAFLRMDLRSDYEKTDVIYSIINMFISRMREDFCSHRIVTKNFINSIERTKALQELGFKPSNGCVIGDDGTKYFSYYELA